MRIRLGVPSQLSGAEKQDVMNAALESVTRANEGLIHRGLPTFDEAGPGKRFRWRPEPPGDEHFDIASTILRRGWGDCDDIAPYAAASLRATGEDPHARAIVIPSASGVPGRWHAIVERSSGELEDPSITAGMRGRVSGDEGQYGPFWPAMRPDRLALASYPLTWPGQGHAARIDVPSMTVPAVYSGLGVGNTPRAAICGAIGPLAEVCGEDAYPEHLAQLAGIHDLLLGVPYDEVAEALEHITGDAVGFFPIAASLAAPFAGKALEMAAPLAGKALGMFGGGAKGGGGGGGGGPPAAAAAAPGQGGGAYYGAPVIIRF
jgi:hypothetical protein